MLKKVLNTIGAKVTVSMLAITVLVIVIAFSSYLLSIRTEENTQIVAQSDIPSAILSVSMLDEIGDMNANVLEYVLGEAEERQEFEDNYLEFTLFFSQLKKASVIRQRRLNEIDRLFSEYAQRARTEIFDNYNPESEGWARQRVQALTNITGERLEDLLDELKESEVADAGRDPSFDEVVNDDLPGVRYYLELVDEAGDMVSNLIKYVNGVEGARREFLNDSQTFEVFLAQLKPLEQRPAEIAALKEVEGLYHVLRDGSLEVFQRYNPNKKKEAIRAIDRLEHEVFSRLEFLLDDISRESSEVASAALSELKDLTENNIYVLSVMVAVVILFCLVVVYYAYRSIVIPITDLITSMQRLTEGRTDQKILYQSRDDEIGTMAASIEVFKQNLIARSEAEVALLEAKERAESASKAKASFLATMSHEIRTPMNGVIGMIDLMMESPMTQEQRSIMKTVRDSSFSLLNIINDILDFSKIEAGKLELEEVSFDLNSVVESVVDTMQISAKDKNVRLDLQLDLDIPLEVKGDPMRLRQVVFNIIGNAIKFSSQGSQDGHVWVRTRRLKQNDDRISLQLQISDNGIGIRQEELEGLFLPFTQAESSTTRRFGGTGLGLAICHNLITLMEGDIRVESQYGQGATFSIELKLKTGRNPNTLEYDASNMMVLLDLHDGNTRELCQDYLHKMDIENLQLGSEQGQKELVQQYLQQGTSILLFKDHQQSATLDELFNRFPNFRKLQFIEDNRSKDGVVNGYTYALECHPLKPSSLIHAMNILLGRESPDTDPEPVPENVSIAPESIQQAQEQGRLILVAEDNQVNQDVISRQLKNLGYLCVVASDGIEAEAMYDLYNYAMVLTDCHMPRRDGYELASLLKSVQKERNEFVPIIAITANALLGEAEKCYEAGMDDYLAKPVEMAKLKKALEQWSGKAVHRNLSPTQKKPEQDTVASLQDKDSSLIASESEVSLDKISSDNTLSTTMDSHTIASDSPAPVNVAEGVDQVIDLTVIEDIYGGDKAGFSDSLDDFLELVLPALQTLNREQNLDPESLKGLLHQYKSPAKAVGLRSLADALENAERLCETGAAGQISDQLEEVHQQLPQVESAIKHWLASHR